jgi:hypothetical protein
MEILAAERLPRPGIRRAVEGRRFDELKLVGRAGQRHAHRSPTMNLAVALRLSIRATTRARLRRPIRVGSLSGSKKN